MAGSKSGQKDTFILWLSQEIETTLKKKKIKIRVSLNSSFCFKCHWGKTIHSPSGSGSHVLLRTVPKIISSPKKSFENEVFLPLSCMRRAGAKMSFQQTRANCLLLKKFPKQAFHQFFCK